MREVKECGIHTVDGEKKKLNQRNKSQKSRNWKGRPREEVTKEKNVDERGKKEETNRCESVRG